MKNNFVSLAFGSFLLPVLFLINCYPGMQAKNAPPATAPSFELKRSGSDFAAFHYNAQGKISEYFLVQVCDWNILETEIVRAEYTEGNDIAFTGKNGHKYIFSIKQPPSNDGSVHRFNVAGIAHFKVLKTEGMDLKEMEEIAFYRIGGVPGSTTLDCDKKCLSGGCGANQCSRGVGGALESSVSCNTGYFACCGDVVSYGCHCIKDCCDKK